LFRVRKIEGKSRFGLSHPASGQKIAYVYVNVKSGAGIDAERPDSPEK
jgi:hypothetical protein